ncbi:hypothetical protein [Sphingobium sp. MP9-4]|uniref:hypothetical protein n=1 Tax=Sphingobium sp. MP9-4 TaxID=1761936 RepID=UPI0010CA8501|nr:hypothetical protein [Sphingobium sp. MP9-4]
MPLLTDALRLYWLPEIANAEADLAMSISDWIREAGFYFKDFVSPGEFSLQLSSVTDVSNLFAATSNRTMSGCFESIASISTVSKVPRSLAWFIIKLYYAAFFGAHGHMRACGLSCANLDAVDAVKLYESAKFQGVAGAIPKINSGQYLIRFNASTRELLFTAIQASGSHEALWATYKKFIEEVIYRGPETISISQQRQFVIDKLKDEITLLSLKGSNGGNWLSKMRNLVQYRHSHGVWYPYAIDKAVPEKLISRAIDKFKSDPDSFGLTPSVGKPAVEIETFVEGSLFISSLARRTVLDMAARSTVKGAVARRGAVSLLKLCSMD